MYHSLVPFLSTGIPLKKDAADKVHRQLADISALVRFVVADSTARFDATGDGTEVDPMG